MSRTCGECKYFPIIPGLAWCSCEAKTPMWVEPLLAQHSDADDVHRQARAINCGCFEPKEKADESQNM